MIWWRGVAMGLAWIALVIGSAHAADPNEEGKGAYQRGDYAVAERLFTKAIAGAPDEPLFHYHRALALTQLGRWSEAIREYETVLRLRPDARLAETSRAMLRTLAAPAPSRRSRDRSDDIEIPLTRKGGGWTTAVVLNDARRAEFLVDTGASISVISTELAKQLGIEADRGKAPITLHTIAGTVVAPMVTIPSVKLGDLEATNVKAVIHDVGLGLDGILGNTFLDRYRITVDAARAGLIVRPR
jgi:clan AA aspartic protease (TIGR02281 family)